MNSIIQALWMGVLSLAQIIFHPIFWLVIYIVSTQYKKQIRAEKKILGTERGDTLGKTLNASIYGLLGGIIGSIIVIIIGASIRQEGLAYLWPIAILLFLFRARYLCFSYAGGLISLFSLIFGFPLIDVPGLMALVGVLHLIESFLIYINGSQDSLPIIVNRGNGEYVGGYSLQRFWPIPIIIMTVLLQDKVDTSSIIQMPDWWPIIKPAGITNIEDITLLMITIVAALGYGDVAFTQMPEVKVKKSALKLGIYSIILLILSVISSRLAIFQWIAALFAPVGHEILIIEGQKTENQGKAIFTVPERGIRVLEAMEGSASEKMGINRGDIIYSINNIPVNSQEDLTLALVNYPPFIWVEGENYRGDKYTKELKAYPYGLRTLGILILPKNPDISYTVEEKEGLILSFIKNKIGKK